MSWAVAVVVFAVVALPIALWLGRRQDEQVFGGLHRQEALAVRAAVRAGVAPDDPRLAAATIAHARTVEREGPPRWREWLDLGAGLFCLVGGVAIHEPLIVVGGLVITGLSVRSLRIWPGRRRSNAARSRAAAEELLRS